MSKKTMILVVATTLCGGLLGKDNKFEPYEVAPGTEITPAVLKGLGLSKDEVVALIEKGAIAEVDVRAAESGGGNAKDLTADLAAANTRADEAEAKVTELEAKVTELEAELEAATKPAEQQ